MKIKRELTRKAGSCNFCDKGELSISGYNLLYPYREVYEIESPHIRVRICDDCLEELIDFKEKTDAVKIAGLLAE